MKPKEVIENLEYTISGECTENFGDFVDEIEMAIEALEKQIPKEVEIIEGDEYHCSSVHCPRCGNMKSFGDKYCDNCGQRLKWGEEDKQTG